MSLRPNSVLSQTYQNFEIIVVDDGPTDETEREISDLDNNKIIYVKHVNKRGANAARNRGIQQSKGEFICFLDSDDVFLEHKLMTLAQEIKQNKNRACQHDCVTAYNATH